MLWFGDLKSLSHFECFFWLARISVWIKRAISYRLNFYKLAIIYSKAK
jgi:hypothetical protein